MSTLHWMQDKEEDPGSIRKLLKSWAAIIHGFVEGSYFFYVGRFMFTRCSKNEQEVQKIARTRYLSTFFMVIDRTTLQDAAIN